MDRVPLLNHLCRLTARELLTQRQAPDCQMEGCAAPWLFRLETRTDCGRYEIGVCLVHADRLGLIMRGVVRTIAPEIAGPRIRLVKR